MPSSILPQNHDEQELYNAISSFFYKFHLGNLLRIKISLCQALLASMNNWLNGIASCVFNRSILLHLIFVSIPC